MQHCLYQLALAAGLFTLVYAQVLPAQAADAAARRLQTEIADLREQFDDVQHVSIDQYINRTRNPETQHSVRLIDVRETGEFAVSHIPGAIHIDSPDALLAYARAHPDEQLLLYCSIGYRSAKAAQHLQAAGISNVANLEGSIFDWANRHQPLVDAHGATTVVHPNSGFWGWRFLSKHVERGTRPRQPAQAHP